MIEDMISYFPSLFDPFGCIELPVDAEVDAGGGDRDDHRYGEGETRRDPDEGAKCPAETAESRVTLERKGRAVPRRKPAPLIFIISKQKEFPMKTILRIIIILLIASAVSAAFFLVINSGTTTNSGESGQPPAMTSADG